MPYWRISGFYLFYFASLGALVPYWGLYLQSLGFSARDIGYLVAIIMLTKVVSPNVWGWVADHTGKRMLIIRIACLFAILSFCGVFVSSDFWWLAVVMATFSFFWNASLPQFEANTFNHLADKSHRYSSIRLWGSIGFVLSVTGLGWWLDIQGTNILPVSVLSLFLGIWVFSLLVPERAARHMSVGHQSLRQILKQTPVAALLGVCFLMQLSHGPYYTFYSIYLETHHYSRVLIGQLWALGVIAEIVVFVFMHRLVPRFGLKNLLIFSLLIAVIRWMVIASQVETIWLMTLAQVLHAATFGIYHACAIQLIHRYFTGRHQGKGQALYSSLSFGAGGALGSFFSGSAWESLGANVTFLCAALVAGLAAFVAWRWIPHDEPA